MTAQTSGRCRDQAQLAAPAALRVHALVPRRLTTHEIETPLNQLTSYSCGHYKVAVEYVLTARQIVYTLIIETETAPRG